MVTGGLLEESTKDQCGAHGRVSYIPAGWNEGVYS